MIFDLEAVFIFSWAVSARRLGWLGYLELLVFVLLLFAGLVYLWRVGALDWGAAGRRRKAARAAARAKPAAVGPAAPAPATRPAGGAARHRRARGRRPMRPRRHPARRARPRLSDGCSTSRARRPATATSRSSPRASSG